jgi:hypothetical protein
MLAIIALNGCGKGARIAEAWLLLVLENGFCDYASLRAE